MCPFLGRQYLKSGAELQAHKSNVLLPARFAQPVAAHTKSSLIDTAHFAPETHDHEIVSRIEKLFSAHATGPHISISKMRIPP
jgi:hypothetical protein